MSEQSARSRRHAAGELVIPVAAIAFTVYFVTTILDSPWTAQVNAFLIGGVLVTLCLIFIVRTVLMLRAGAAEPGFGNLVGRDDLASGRALLFAATLAYVILIDRGGFTLSTFLFLLAAMAILGRGRRLGRAALVSAAMALGGWALFIWAFDTRFPRGWFEEAMQAALAHG